MDLVIIEGLEVDASVGVFDWEKGIKQLLVFDLNLETDFKTAAISDDICDAVDYAAVCEVVQEIVRLKHYQLLEHLAENIAQAVFEGFAVHRLELTIRKPGAVPSAKSVGIKINRQKSLETK